MGLNAQAYRYISGTQPQELYQWDSIHRPTPVGSTTRLISVGLNLQTYISGTQTPRIRSVELNPKTYISETQPKTYISGIQPTDLHHCVHLHQKVKGQFPSAGWLENTSVIGHCLSTHGLNHTVQIPQKKT